MVDSLYFILQIRYQGMQPLHWILFFIRFFLPQCVFILLYWISFYIFITFIQYRESLTLITMQYGSFFNMLLYEFQDFFSIFTFRWHHKRFAWDIYLFPVPVPQVRFAYCCLCHVYFHDQYRQGMLEAPLSCALHKLLCFGFKLHLHTYLAFSLFCDFFYIFCFFLK